MPPAAPAKRRRGNNSLNRYGMESWLTLLSACWKR
jgi:hypothetical protein